MLDQVPPVLSVMCHSILFEMKCADRSVSVFCLDLSYYVCCELCFNACAAISHNCQIRANRDAGYPVIVEHKAMNVA